MELMSSVLLCTLVAFFSQTLGDALSKDYDDLDMITKWNSSKKHKKNDKPPMFVNFISDIEYVFKDMHCKKCIPCMEHALKAYKAHTEVVNKPPTISDLQISLLDDEYDIKHRPKRNIETEVKAKKPKKKINKSITVTKYNVGGGVYGLKVRESAVHGREQNNNDTSTCRVYSVKKTYDCDSPESEMFLSAAKRKLNKKNKKEKDKDKTTVRTTEKAHFHAPLFRKRQVDQSEVPENFEFSIEEMY